MTAFMLMAQKKLEFERQYRQWTSADWQNVSFSNESRFLHSVGGATLVHTSCPETNIHHYYGYMLTEADLLSGERFSCILCMAIWIDLSACLSLLITYIHTCRLFLQGRTISFNTVMRRFIQLELYVWC